MTPLTIRVLSAEEERERQISATIEILTGRFGDVFTMLSTEDQHDLADEVLQLEGSPS